MNDSLRRRYEMALRVKDFGVKYIVNFPEGFLGRQYFDELDTIIADIQRLAMTQESSDRSGREGTKLRGEAREDLQDELEVISETARAMAIETPGLEDKFRMPRGRATDVDLLNIARAFAADALPLRDRFMAHGLPADFLDKLNSAIEALERAMAEQQRRKSERSSATAGLDDAVEKAVNKVRQLDAAVRNKFRENLTVLSEWEAARHVRRAPVSSEEETPEHTT
ncbi:MAG TPA: hypothetical protein VJS44_14940 [Pyrinomonadaceae bacterium]|nr:hypothetical protein [Pyrinomonadaceae bacterium]